VVTFVDTTPPTLVIPDQTVESQGSTGFVDMSAFTANDLVDGDPCCNPTHDGPVDGIFPVGVTQVTWEATDSHGNRTEGIQIINVVKKLQDVDPTQPGVLEVSPAQEVKSSGKEGGPFDLDSQDYQLSNTGGQPLNFSASADVNWLTVGTTSGTISPQGGALVNVKLKANASSNLPKGTHTAVITFSDTTDTTNVVDVVRTWTLRVK